MSKSSDRQPTVDGQIFVTHGDITGLTADAIAIPTSVDRLGRLAPAFRERFPDFVMRYNEALRQNRVPPESLRAGRAFWIPLCSTQEAAEGEASPGPKPPFGVVAVQVFDLRREVYGEGVSVWTTDHPAYRAAAGAIRTAAKALQALRGHLSNGDKRRFLLAVPALRMGGGGDRSTPLPSAELQILAARAALDEFEGLDIVFVTYTPDIYEVYLEARRRVGSAPAIPEGELPEAWQQLTAATRRAECVVFVGSGLSRDAGITGYQKLIQRLAADLRLPPPKDNLDSYFDLAQWHREEFPQQQETLIQSYFGGSTAKPTLAHYMLTSLPTSFFMTTNYDSLLEAALLGQRREPERIVTEHDVAQTGRRRATYVVKFHGDADAPASAVLSRDDYDNFFEHPRGRAMAVLLEGLLLNQPFLFVGYSLRDPNFRQIYNRIAGLLRDSKRPAFATTFEPVTDYARNQWRTKGLHLIEIRDEGAGQAHYLWRLLDQLATYAAGGERLFLAADSGLMEAAAEPTAELRQSLIEGVGNQVMSIHHSRRTLPLIDVRQTARVMGFLTAQGWRPRRVTLPLLWWRLAERLEECALSQARIKGLGAAEAEELSEEARKMLANALRHSEGIDRIQKIRSQRQQLALDVERHRAFQARRIIASGQDAVDAEE